MIIKIKLVYIDFQIHLRSTLYNTAILEYYRILIMKVIKSIFILVSITFSYNAFANTSDVASGEKLYHTYCSSCHGINVGGMDFSKRIAPPIAAVRMHYKSYYPDETSFIQAVSNWVEDRNPEKSLMRGAIRRFNIMPPVAISKQDAGKIAAHIYSGNIEKPDGFEEHVNKEHKNRRGLRKGFIQE